jgi:AraC-like DNA-binding protein
MLVDESRRQLAKQLLRETGYPLAEIAFLTGFSEQSAFNRAFKRWAGQTPRSFRIEAQPSSG